MLSSRFDEARDYSFADRVLALRQRAGLTQGELAALIGVGVRSVQAWEAAVSYPGADHLQQLVAVHLEHGGFAVGREMDEASALWEAARTHAPRRIIPFDRRRFESLRSMATSAASAAAPSAGAPSAHRDDWRNVPDAGHFFGRTDELQMLARWLLEDRCRLIGVLGAGGIGKTLLAARLAREATPQFAVVHWRSLRNAPPVEEWLAGAIAALSAQQALPPDGYAARLDLLLQLLQAQRGLLVLDNMETILEPGAPEPRYRDGYVGYGEVLRRVAESVHQSCLLLTGRETPPELVPLARERGPVRTLRLGGLGREAARALLKDRGLVGDAATWEALIAHYRGNPLALNVVGETINAVFAGEIAAFLAQEAAVFGGIRQLLDEQVVRLSALEQAVLSWLAVEREPVRFAELAADLEPGTERGAVMEAVAALQRRSLLESGENGTFTLQPVVLEYATTRLIAELTKEILAGMPALLVRQALLKATAKDYVRRSQERLIAQPLLVRLGADLGGPAAVERQLLTLQGRWRGRPAAEQGYGPGNVVNLLRLLRGDLRGLDLSHLTIRHAYLQGVEAQDASLAGAHLAEAVLAEAFPYTTALALSADGAFLAAGTPLGEVRLWRVADGTLLLAAQGHGGAVRGMALSADGRLLASGGDDCRLRLWWAPSGQLLATLQGHTGAVYCVALSGDGRLLASGGQDGTVRLWEASSGQLLATLLGHSGVVWGVALSGDGQLVASGADDGIVRLWEVPSGQLLATLHGHSGLVRSVALSGDGLLLASGGQDGTVRVWEVLSGQLLATLQGYSVAVWGVALSDDGRLLASGNWDGTVRLWEVPSGQPLVTLQGHTGMVRGVALSGDGRLLASGGVDGRVRLWEASNGQLLASVQGYSVAVWGVALSGDGRTVASGGVDGMVRLWGAPSGQFLATLVGHSGLVRGVALTADGRLLASGGDDGTVRLWEASGQLLATLQGHSGVVLGVALSGDGRTVASSSWDETVRLWKAPSGQLLATLQGHTGLVQSVALSGDGRMVASGGVDGMVRLWGAPSGQFLATLQGHSGVVWSVALTADGRLLASGGDDGTVRLWEAPSGQLLATMHGHTGLVAGVALSWDGLLLASGGVDGTVRLWEAPSGQLLATLHGHTGPVAGVALSGDGQLLASGGADGMVRLWEVRSGACLHTLWGDRRYERLDITGLTGVTKAQRAALLSLGARDGEQLAAQWSSLNGIARH